MTAGRASAAIYYMNYRQEKMPPRATCGATEPQNTLLGKGAPKINSAAARLGLACQGFPGLKVKCTQASPVGPGLQRDAPASRECSPQEPRTTPASLPGAPTSYPPPRPERPLVEHGGQRLKRDLGFPVLHGLRAGGLTDSQEADAAPPAFIHWSSAPRRHF